MPQDQQQKKPQGKVASSIRAIGKRLGGAANVNTSGIAHDRQEKQTERSSPPKVPAVPEGLMRSRFAAAEPEWQQVLPKRGPAQQRNKAVTSKIQKSSELNNDPTQYRVQTLKYWESKNRIVVADWSEPAGPTKSEHNVTRTRLGSRVFGKPRYFAVVQVAPKFCWVVALSTHGLQGTGHLDSRDYGIAYKGTVVPAPMPGEEGLQPVAIQVVLDNPDEEWSPRSRVSYRKVYMLEHHNKVRPVGFIAAASLPAFYQQVLKVSALDFRPNKSDTEVQGNDLYERLRAQKKLTHEQALHWVRELFKKSEAMFELNRKMSNL